jgi:hypothetical protein
MFATIVAVLAAAVLAGGCTTGTPQDNFRG